MVLQEARRVAKDFIQKIKPFVKRVEIAGSVRRERPLVKDIEIVLIPDPRQIWELVDEFGKYRKLKGSFAGKYFQIQTRGVKVDVFVASEENWGVIYSIRTGSARFSKDVIAGTWARLGYHSIGGVLYPIQPNSGAVELGDAVDLSRPHYFKEEVDLFKFLGLQWVPPKERE